MGEECPVGSHGSGAIVVVSRAVLVIEVGAGES